MDEIKDEVKKEPLIYVGDLQNRENKLTLGKLEIKENNFDPNCIQKVDWRTLRVYGLLEIGDNTYIDEGVWLCHDLRNGSIKKTTIGKNTRIRSGSIIYSDVVIGDNVNLGHNVIIREGCTIGNNTSIGTGVCIECYTKVGDYVSVETQTHLTGWMEIEDRVFIGGFCGFTNDMQMKWKREGHGKNLKGALVKYGARVGSGAIILPAITIGRHSIINAGEIVRKDVPDMTMMFTEKNKVIYKKIVPEEFII